MNNSQNLPDFQPQGYQTLRLLGQNINGGRVTYLAQDLTVDRAVVIKQFQFATIGNSWSDYDTYQREVEILQQLDFPSIPKYLTSWETPSGFCLVQEYKAGKTLSDSDKDFTLEKVQQIAINLLEILIYLQQQQPPIIHRDIKPENILIDEVDRVYLIDFGFARSSKIDPIASSTIKGTLGFMPPEQLFNRPLTKSADLYGLGVTLVCLLTGHKSLEIDQLIDHNYRIDIRSNLGHLPPQFLNWLIQITEPNPEHRYPDAQTALAALQTQAKPKCTPIPWQQSIVAGIFLIISLGLIVKHNYQPSPGTIITLTQIQTDRGCAGCNLAWFNLRGMNLQSYDFTGANLTGADIRDADMRGASLRDANLTNAMTVGANLASTDLRGAKMPNK